MAKSLGKQKTQKIDLDGEEYTIRQLSCLQVNAMVDIEEKEGSDSMNLLFYLLCCSLVNDDGTYLYRAEDKDEVLANTPVAIMKDASEYIMDFNGFGDEDEGK